MIRNIALEGTHCSGKTTLINKFKKFHGKEVFVVDEMIRKLDGADSKNKLSSLEDKIKKLNLKSDDATIINDELKDLSDSIQEGSFRFHLNNYSYEDINTYFFSEDVLINLYFGILESLKSASQKDIYLFQEGTKFLYDRCFLSPLYYMRYFMQCAETLDKLSEINLKKLNDMYRKSIDRVCQYRDSNGFEDWLFLVLKPLALNIDDEFRLKGDEIQTAVHNICIETLNVLNINYVLCDQKEAEDIISSLIF